MKYYIAIVIPCYNEEKNIEELYKKLFESIQRSKKIKRYKLYFFDDCSNDNTLSEIKKIEDKNVIIIESFKKVGKSIGLGIAFHIIPKNIDLVFMMDGDLQDDPKELDNFIIKVEQGYDLVTGYKKIRNDRAEKKIASKLYNFFINLVFGINLHDHNCGFKCFKRNVIDSLKLYGNLHRFITVFANFYGFKISEIVVKHHKRKYGKSKYGISRYFTGLADIVEVKFILRYLKKETFLFELIATLLVMSSLFLINKNIFVIIFILVTITFILMVLNLEKYIKFNFENINCFKITNNKN